MDCDVIQKVKKLYRIHNVFVKYNIFDRNAFEKDNTFKYIMQNIQLENDKAFQDSFQKKYTHEISKTKEYKDHCEKTQDDSETQNTNDEDDAPQENNNDKNSPDEQEDAEEEFESQKKNTTKIKSIKEIDKTMYKKIVIISHPDKSTDTERVVVFKDASEHMNNDWTIGLVHCCGLLKIKLDFIYVTDEIVHHCFKQMREVIQEIMQLYNIRQSQ